MLNIKLDKDFVQWVNKNDSYLIKKIGFGCALLLTMLVATAMSIITSSNWLVMCLITTIYAMGGTITLYFTHKSKKKQYNETLVTEALEELEDGEDISKPRELDKVEILDEEE